MGAYGGYIRVSVVGDRDGERFISPSLQRDRITGWAAAHGHDLADIREDLDVSGGSRKRPQLEALIGQIEPEPLSEPLDLLQRLKLLLQAVELAAMPRAALLELLALSPGRFENRTAHAATRVMRCSPMSRAA